MSPLDMEKLAKSILLLPGEEEQMEEQIAAVEAWQEDLEAAGGDEILLGDENEGCWPV